MWTAPPRSLDWNELATDPGWCKLDWVVADPDQKRLTNASNVIDVTWESPTATSCPSTATWTPTSRRSTSTPGSCRRSPRWSSTSPGNALDDYIDQLEGRGAQVPRRRARQLRQGREADVQRLPAHRAAPRCGLPARAVRRAHHDALPGLVADQDARERVPARLDDPDGDGAGADRRARAHRRDRRWTASRRRSSSAPCSSCASPWTIRTTVGRTPRRARSTSSPPRSRS